MVVYDGLSSLSDKKGQFCGSNKPSGVIYSSNEYMYVVFVSSGDTGYPGFKASYEKTRKLTLFSAHRHVS